MSPDDDASSDADRESVLSPEELDITDDEHVVEIEDGRFVISPGEGQPAVGESVRDDASAVEVTERHVREWLVESLEASDARYGFDVTVKVDDRVARNRLVSDDVVAVFETLLVWYAQRIGTGTPIEEVLGILLLESNVPVRYPPDCLERLLDRHELGPDDSIADLLDAVDDGIDIR